MVLFGFGLGAEENFESTRGGMNIPIRFKLFLLMAVILISAIVALLYKTSQTFFEDKNLFVREFSDRFTGSVARMTSDRILKLQNDVAVLVSNRESLAQVKSSDELGYILFDRFPDFFATAVVEKNAEGKWTPRWIAKNLNSSSKEWPASFDQTLVSSINMDATAEGGIFLSRLAQPNGLPAFGISYVADLAQAQAQQTQATGLPPTEKVILVGIVTNTAFEDIVRDYKGTLTEVFILDSRGFVYAHPKPQIMGSNIDNHPMVEEFRQSRKESGVGEFLDLDGEKVIGSYQKVKGTNMYAASSTPMDEAFRAAKDLTNQVIVFGLGFVILGLVLTIIFAGRITTPLAKLQEIASKIGAGDFNVPINIKSKDEVGDLAISIEQMKAGLIEREEKLEHSKAALIQSEKMSAFGQLSAGIAHEVKNPLAGILGHAQLAKSKSAGNEDLRKHLEVIEKETRRTKEIIEGLMKFARAEKAELVPTNLYDSVMSGIDLVEHQLNLMGVKIHRKLNPVPLVAANSNQLQQVFLNIMMNAGHAMEKSDTKELTIYLEPIDKAARVRIQDTGSGMPPDVQKRIFEPFFTTKPAGKGTGLGLSVSTGIIRDHHGKMYVESEVGKGTTFFIEIPLAEGHAQIAEPTRKHEPAADVQAIATPSLTPPPLVAPPPPTVVAETKEPLIQAPPPPQEVSVPPVPPMLAAKKIEEEDMVVPPSPMQSMPASTTATPQTPVADIHTPKSAPVPAPAKEVAKATDSTDSNEFKVTIRRPKLKG